MEDSPDDMQKYISDKCANVIKTLRIFECKPHNNKRHFIWKKNIIIEAIPGRNIFAEEIEKVYNDMLDDKLDDHTTIGLRK